MPRELLELLKKFADAYAHPLEHTGAKEKLMFHTALGIGTRVQHHALEGDGVNVSIGDLEELDGFDLIDIDYGRGPRDGTFRVTTEGYNVVDQLEQHDAALASDEVVPEEGARMGFDWATDVFPVLRAVNDLYQRAPSHRGVSQDNINEALGRPKGTEHTGLVLRKLEEAGFVSGTIRVDQVDGPLFCEPTTQAFELLAGWPTERGDMALARLVAALEARISTTDDEDEKGKLRDALGSVRNVSESVMAGVLTKVIIGGDVSG